MRNANEMIAPLNFQHYLQSAIGIALIAAFLSYTGVYDYIGLNSFGARWLFWMLTLLVGNAAANITKIGLKQADVSLRTQNLAVLTTSTIAVTLAIYWGMKILGQNIPRSYLPQLLGMVLVISSAYMVISFMFQKSIAASPREDEADSKSIERFLERLPKKFHAAKLYAVSSEDHYLRVHTNLGEELILMRLSDAIHTLSDAKGLQTHRSWWVAQSGVDQAERENDKLFLILKSGTKVPVSRRHQSAVKDSFNH